jgi:type IV pilus assembly protein PilX
MGGRVASAQRGIALLVVMLVVLLSSLLALWAFRTSLVNETIVGNDADYQRAFEAAQAMVQDAELDIRGERSDGAACVSTADAKVCRRGSTMAFIEETRQLGNLLGALDAETTRCRDGICQKRTGAQDFWATDAMLTPMMGSAARYGEYTGARLPGDSKAKANPLLAWNNSDARDAASAWYWVEVMPYDSSPAGLLAGRDKLDLNLNPNVVYRITAIARGLKPRTQVVLQSTLARQKLRN